MTQPSTLRGPSGEAGARLHEQLVEALASVGSRKAAQVGSELFGVAHLVRTAPRLRRVVTDVSLEDGAKAALVGNLLDGKVDQLVLDLLATAVVQRWTAPRDFADTLENLGVEASVRSADDPGRVADELFAVGRLLTEQPELRDALGDSSRSADDRRELLGSLLQNRTLAATAQLVAQAQSSSHRTVELAIAAYQKIAASVQGERVATVRTARELSTDEQERLAAALTRQYSIAVHLNVVVDPELIGGFRVEIGDDVIDGTIANRLDDARRRLAG